MTNDSITSFSVERISIGILTQSDTRYQAQKKSSSCTNYSNRNKARRENDSQNIALKPSQLSLLPAIAATSQTAPTIAQVPQRIALAPDRCYIWLIKDFERWNIPIQFTELEVRSLLPLVEGERDRSVILKIVESAIGGTV